MLSMTGSPKVSIIMPVYNGGSYFELAVESALAQSYQNIEILIVNDGSSDNGYTDAVGRRFQQKFPEKVRYFFQENAGVAGALNAGIDNMLGEYFCWLSHDDLYHKNKIEKQISAIKACGDQDVLLFGDWEYIDHEGNYLYSVVLDGDHIKGSSVAAVLGGAMNGCTVMVSKASLGSSRFDTRYRCVQDYRLWYELAERVTFIRHPEVLVRQRLHPGQDTNRLKEVAINEGEALWQDMVFGTSLVLRAAIDGSNFRFLSRMSQRLTQMPYPEACSRVTEAAEASLEEIRVSVIFVNNGNTIDFARDFLDESAGGKLQYIVVGPDVATNGPYESIIVVSNIYDALNACDGEYITIVNLDDGLFPIRLLNEQARAMSQSGHLVSIRKKHDQEANLSVASLAISSKSYSSAIMAHRYLLAAGEFSRFDIDEQFSSAFLRILSTYPYLIVDSKKVEVIQ